LSLFDSIDELVTGGGDSIDSLGEFAEAIPGAVEQGVRTAFSFGAGADPADIWGALTGFDPLHGMDLSRTERLLSVAGLAGAGAVGGLLATRTGRHALYESGRFLYARQISADSERGATLLPIPVGSSVRNYPWAGDMPERMIPAAIRTVPDAGLFFRTSRQFSNDVLGVMPEGPATGYALAERLGASPSAAGFLDAARHKLVEAVDWHQASVARAPDPDAARWLALEFETVRLDHAVENDLLAGPLGKRTAKAWRRLRSGEELSPVELEDLTTGWSRFARLMEWNPNPELWFTGNPLGRIAKADLDDSTMTFEVLMFPGAALSDLSAGEVNRRVVAMIQHNPHAAAEIIEDNLVRLYDAPGVATAPEGELSLLDRYREWYPTARRQIEEAFASSDASLGQAVTFVSLTSAGTDWTENVAMARKVWDVVGRAERKRKRDFAALHAELRAAKLSVSRDDVMRLLIAKHVTPEEFYTGGQATGGLNLTGGPGTLQDLWERRTDPRTLLELRKRPGAWAGLKQEEFDEALRFSTDADIASQAMMMERLLSGFLGGSPGEVVGQAAREAGLALVVDRQAVKGGWGASILPQSNLYNKGVYDVVAHGFRLAAVRIGEIPALGRPLLPEELQAILWMKVKLDGRSSVIDDLTGLDRKSRGRVPASVDPVTGEKIPAKPSELAPAKIPFGTRLIGGTAGWRNGSGPTWVFDDRFLRLASGRDNALALAGVDAVDVDAAAPPVRIEDWDPGRPPSGKGRSAVQKVLVHVDATGTPSLAFDGVTMDRAQARGRWATAFADPRGGVVWAPVRPAVVDDVERELDRLLASSATATDPRLPSRTGVAIHPGAAPEAWTAPGIHMHVSPLQRLPDLSPGEASIRRLETEMRRLGVRYTVTPQAAPHTGISFAWVGPNQKRYWSGQAAVEDGLSSAEAAALVSAPTERIEEVRIGATVTFDSPEDLQRTTRMLYDAAEMDDLRSARGAYLDAHARRFGLEQFPAPVRFRPLEGEDLAAWDAERVALALEYDSAPMVDPEAVPAWDQLEIEVEAQYEFITEELGIDVKVVDSDPYPDYAAMIDDVVTNRTLKVLRSSEVDHPYWSAATNDKFRAVHDFFGHTQVGNSFTRYGEDVAWALHAQMFSPLARRAMTTETRGQNAWLTSSPSNLERQARGARNEFGPQKVVLLPERYSDPAPLLGAQEQLERMVDRIFLEQTLDARVYVDSPEQAPFGMVQFNEHYATDPYGRTVTNINRTGDPQGAHSVSVHVMADFASYIEPTRVLRHTPESGFVDGLRPTSESSGVLDGRAEVVSARPMRPGRKKGLLGLVEVRSEEGKWGAPSLAVITWPPSGTGLLPQVEYLDEVPAALGAGQYLFDSKTVRVATNPDGTLAGGVEADLVRRWVEGFGHRKVRLEVFGGE
jgi:hypothetical protein